MTREKRKIAVEEFKEWRDSYYNKNKLPATMFIEEVIKILEQESCEDAISRQATIEAFQMFRGYESNRTNAEWVDRIETIVKKLSPVTQEPKIGHWIEDDMTYCGVDLTNYKCDKCGEIGGSWRKGLKPDKLPKYCMNCGCRMVEPQERSKQE